MMQLFYSPASPYVRKVRVLLAEAGKADEVGLIPPQEDVTDSSHIVPTNPLGRMPTLKRDDGPAIYDSRVICRYLDAQFSVGLYPEARLWEVLTLEATGDGILDSALLMVYEGRFRPAEKVHAPWVDRQWGKVADALDALEDRWMSLLAGPLNAGQISVACALGYLDFRHGDRGWRDGRAALAEWYAAFAARESMKATAPDA